MTPIGASRFFKELLDLAKVARPKKNKLGLSCAKLR
jgi:hypothetical protein